MEFKENNSSSGISINTHTTSKQLLGSNSECKYVHTSKITENFGIYINDINLADLSNEKVTYIKKLLSLHGLIVFNGQSLDDNGLVSFGKKIGNGELEQPARNTSLSSDRRFVAWLTNLKDSEGSPLGFSDNKTDYWHSDQEFRINPASISIIYCEQIECIGGATSFASTKVNRHFFENDFIKTLEQCWSTRLPASSHDNVPHIKVAHPVIIENGNAEFFYISENTLDILKEGEKISHSEETKNIILSAVLNEKNIYSHYWSAGDLLLYDNSQLLHRREAFSGKRFLKAMKIFPDTSYNVSIPGKEVSNEKNR